MKAKLYQAVMAYIGNFMLTAESQERLRETFRAIDTNGDGVLERDELIEGYIRSGIDRLQAEQVVKDLLLVADLNGDGKINYSEFLMATLKKEEAVSEERLRGAFRMIDKVPNCLAKPGVGRERNDLG